MDDSIYGAEIHTILSSLDIDPICIEFIEEDSKHRALRINGNLLVKLSDSSFDDEAKKLKRAESISFASKLRHVGSAQHGSGVLHYIVIDCAQGTELFKACEKLTNEQQKSIGKSAAEFLYSLHSIAGSGYDIGHYVPTITNQKGSWLEGHRRYWEILKDGIADFTLLSSNRWIVQTAIGYMEERADCLSYQDGPCLLHNDFHPKNIIINNGALSGVIDWECSQYGEADFDLTHVVHWTIFPPNAEVNLKPFLISIVVEYTKLNQIPDLSMRLTLYQIEHDINQLIWAKGETQNERCERIERWMAGAVADALREI